MSVRNKVYQSVIDLGKKNHHVMKVLRQGQFATGRMRYLYQYVMHAIHSDTILFEAYSGRQYACSPRAIYEEMQRENLDFHYIWAVNDVEKYAFLKKNKNTRVVKAGSRDYYRAFATAKFWVVNSKKNMSIFKRQGQVYIQTWHGTPLKKIGCDLENDKANAMSDIAEIHRSYREDAAKYDYLISPSAFVSDVFVSAFDLKGREDIIVETGYPRNDALYNWQPSEIRALKEKLQIPLDKKVILYAPTWRDDQHEAGVGYTWQLPFDLKELYDALHEDYVILLRLHYLVADSVSLDGYEDFIYQVSDYDNINDLYLVSDLLVTDYSSVFFDYASLEKPIFFYMYDYDVYKNELRDFYIDVKTLPGPISHTLDELVRDIRHAATYAFLYHQAYQTFRETYNALDDGNASRRVIKRCILSELSD